LWVNWLAARGLSEKVVAKKIEKFFDGDDLGLV
jgi:hypothetical protein